MKQVTINVSQGIARITLDAPPVNTLDRPMVTQLGELLERCAGDDQVRALIVCGSGTRAFCAGSDLDELRALIGRGREALARKFAQDHEVFGRLADFPKPTVAAIEGAATGGGLELAVCCDFVVAAQDARLSLPEIHLGAFPGSGGTLRVTRRIGVGRAHRMMLLGETVDARRALEWGLVDEVCERGAALDVATQLAHRLAQGPMQALRGCKASIAAALKGTEAAALELASAWAVDVGFSGDLTEGLLAFQERRRPRFAGALPEDPPAS